MSTSQRSFARRALFFTVLASLLTAPAFAAPVPEPSPAESDSSVASGFVSATGPEGAVFEPNLGQAPSGFAFTAAARGVVALLAPHELVVAVPKSDGDFHALRYSFEGARRDASAVAGDALPGHATYLRGDDPASWATRVPRVSGVTFRDVWPGVDVVHREGPGGALEHDFVLAPGVDPSVVRFAVHGADALRVSAGGALVAATPAGEVALDAPVLYQDGPAGRVVVDGAFLVAPDGVVSYRVGSFDRALPLVIDPVLDVSTLLGGATFDMGQGVATDAAGAIYLAGATNSVNFPLEGPFQGTIRGNNEGFVTKLAPDGGSIAYSTYIGSSAYDIMKAVRVDADGRVWVAGETRGSDFPTRNPFQSYRGDLEVVLFRLSADGGTLEFGSFLGGSAYDTAQYLLLEPDGDVVVVGGTYSTNFPRLGSSIVHRGSSDGFATRVTAGGLLAWSALHGGSDHDVTAKAALDAAGGLHVVGATNSGDLPTVGPFQSERRGLRDGYVATYAADGALTYATYLGGNGHEQVRGIAVDAAGARYVTGETHSSDYPTASPHQPLRGSTDAFVTKLAPGGTSLEWSTFLGGALLESGEVLLLDEAGGVFVAGRTYSSDFPLVEPLQSTHAGGQYDNFLARYDAAGGPLTFSTFLGGAGYDNPHDGTVDAFGRILLTGFTASPNFPTTPQAHQTTFGGLPYDAWVARYSFCAPPVTSASLSGTSGDNGWWRSDVAVTLTAKASCGIVTATHHAVDGGPFVPGTEVTVSGDGEHVVAYYSEDSEGRVENVREVAFAIDATAPRVTLVDPASGAVYVGGERAPADVPAWPADPAPPAPPAVVVGAVTLRADASDATSGVAFVEFLVDGVVVGRDEEAPFEHPFTAGEGVAEHRVAARAADVAGNDAAADVAVVAVGHPPPPDPSGLVPSYVGELLAYVEGLAP